MSKIIINLFQRTQSVKTNDSIEKIKTIAVLNALFIGLLTFDIIVRTITSSWYLAVSSLILVVFLMISRYFIIVKSNLERAGEITSIIFYVIALYHSHFTQAVIVPYFILLLTPILSALILQNLKTKVIFFFLSSILFLVCNYLAGLHILSNGLFYIGLIPAFLQ